MREVELNSEEFRPSSIPHFFVEVGGVGKFFRSCLNIEFTDDVPVCKSYIARNPKSPDARNLREALEYLLRERSATDRKEPPESPDDVPPPGYGV
ncbi:hypothetical protein [Streptomyces decoyicus]|uniref:hypothetical protein n=1 Tax=Streptomyces decoyicus TaxID=249567 RepID=UPI00099B66C3|nr:hypothetical protein [Streptomyces decoyicus]QZY16889.1 hypothetical protein K7C20_17885 [Streptomyces decoyicus]